MYFRYNNGTSTRLGVGVMDFPTAPVVGQQHARSRRSLVSRSIYWDGAKWTADPLTGAVRYDAAQSLSASQQAQARDDICSAQQRRLARNVVINGDFRVNQGGYVSAAALSCRNVWPRSMEGRCKWG